MQHSQDFHDWMARILLLFLDVAYSLVISRRSIYIYCTVFVIHISNRASPLSSLRRQFSISSSRNHLTKRKVSIGSVVCIVCPQVVKTNPSVCDESLGFLVVVHRHLNNGD